MANVDKLVGLVSSFLFEAKQIPSYEKLLAIVKNHANSISILDGGDPFSDEELNQAVAKIQTKHDTTMGLGQLFAAETYTPWLVNKRGEISFYYWGRYKELLKKKMSEDVVKKLDIITDEILDHLENPHKEGSWERRGLVVGHVQSGKTANYIGVINKAADAGYKVIIVLGGMLNSLRNQTQRRIDSDFFGFCTKKKKELGVAQFDNSRRPLSLTTSIEDFKKVVANRVHFDLNALNEPVVLVIKKNVSTLKNLREWLRDSNKRGLSNYPLLLVDDEADNATINTNSTDKNPTEINKGIRELLKMFPRNSYLGYTATPFANIFINPDSEHMMEDGTKYKDLFPCDFILSLDPPTNYIGPDTLFGDEESDVLEEVSDFKDLLPSEHKKDFSPQGLPPSLKKAINCFMLVKTIRELDGQKNKHHSMMINVSRFTDVQEKLKVVVSSYLEKCLAEIKNYAGLPEDEALAESKVLSELKSIWEMEFKNFDQGWTKRSFSWEEVQHQLNNSTNTIVVLSINNDSTDRLDYDDYPSGRSVIAIGGLGLSRGLTLEGLSVSYFLRNSIMYDTLLQMGRWFGYRDGYANLCRVFMPVKSISWYRYITAAIDELRKEFKDMKRLGLTPSQFGLKVRSHPTSLIITARNKMRDAEKIVCKIALEGRFPETSRLINDPKVFADNAKVLERAVENANKESRPQRDRLGWLWKNVSIDIIENLVSDFKNAPDCLLTTKTPLLEHISWLRNTKGMNKCDILLRGRKGEECVCGGLSFTPTSRSLENQNLNDKRLTFIKRHIISRGDEAAGLTQEQIEAIQKKYQGENVPDREYRRFKYENGCPPLLILEFVRVFPSIQEVTSEGKRHRTRIKGEGIVVPAYGISFPGNPSGRKRPENLVTYTVNRVYLSENVDVEWREDLDEMEDEND